MRIPQIVRKKYRKYSKEAMLNAYKAVKEANMPVLKAAVQFNVPEQTLRDRVKGKVDAEKLKLGTENLFNEEEELSLVEHLETISQLGYGYTNMKLKYLGGELAANLNRRTNNKPLSNCWLYGFIKRWKFRLTSLKPKELDSHEAKDATQEVIQVNLPDLQTTMEKYDLSDKPQYIYNIDEIAVQLERGSPKNDLSTYSKPQAIASQSFMTTTIIACANAIGNHMPPFLIFKGKQFSHDIMKGSSPGAKGVMSDSGCTNSSIFQKYLKEHFLPNVGRGIDQNQHILLIVDHHASHELKALSEWAMSQKIILFVLPACRSYSSPLNISIFGPLKTFYNEDCVSFMHTCHGKTVTHYDICELACQAYLKAMAPINIISGFRKSGIFPFSKEAVHKHNLSLIESVSEERPLEKVNINKSDREAIKKFLMQKTDCYWTNKSTTKNNTKSTVLRSKHGDAATIERGKANVLDISEEIKIKLNKHNSHESVSPASPTVSCSGLSVHGENSDSSEITSDEDSDESDVCCVCNQFLPPDCVSKQHKKTVTWAECDKCGHWVHLTFCTQQSFIRRKEPFLCPHCSIPKDLVI